MSTLTCLLLEEKKKKKHLITKSLPELVGQLRQTEHIRHSKHGCVGASSGRLLPSCLFLSFPLRSEFTSPIFNTVACETSNEGEIEERSLKLNVYN